MLKLGHDGGESRRVEGRAGIFGVKELMDAVEEASHADASEEVEGGLLGCGGRFVGVVCSREGDGGFYTRNAGDGAGSEFGDVVAKMLAWTVGR